jgi:hypothetical protein
MRFQIRKSRLALLRAGMGYTGTLTGSGRSMADYGLVASGGKLTLPLCDNSSPKPFEMNWELRTR